YGRLLGDADEQASQDGPVRVADAAQDDGGEHGQEEMPAQLRVYRPGHGVKDAAGGGETAGGDPCPENDAIHVHTAGPGQVHVVGHGPHGLADDGVPQHQVEKDHQKQGDDDDEFLVAG